MDQNFHSSLKELRLQLDLMNSRTASILNKPRQQSNMLTPDSTKVELSPSVTADSMHQIKHIGATVGTLAKHQEDRFQALENQLNALSDKLDDLVLDHSRFTPLESPSESDPVSSHSDTASISSPHSTMPPSPRLDMVPATVADVGGYFYPNHVQRGSSDQQFITSASSFVGRVKRTLRTKSIPNIEIFLRGSALRWFHLGLRTDGTHVLDNDKDEFDITKFCESLILLFGVPVSLAKVISAKTLRLTPSWTRSVILEDFIFPALEAVWYQEDFFDEGSGASCAVSDALARYNQSLKPCTVSFEPSDCKGYTEILDFEDLLDLLSRLRRIELEQKLAKILSENRKVTTDAAFIKKEPLSYSKVQQNPVPAVVSGFNGKMSPSSVAGLHDRFMVQLKSSSPETPGDVEIEDVDSVASAVGSHPRAPTVESCPTTPVGSCQTQSSNLNSESQANKACEEPRISQATHSEKEIQPIPDDATYEYTFGDYFHGDGGMFKGGSVDNKRESQSSGRAAGQYPPFSPMSTVSHTLYSAPDTGSLDVHKTGADNCLAGLGFVFTGQSEHMSGEGVQNLVKSYGGKVTVAPSESTDYVVLGADVAPKKLSSFKEHNFRAIDEQGFFNLISKLPARDRPVSEQNKEAESLKNATKDVLGTTIVPHQEDGSSSIQTPEYQSQQQTSEQQQIHQAQGSFPLGPQAKAFLKDFQVFTPTEFSPNTPEYEGYQTFVMNALTRLVAMQDGGISRFQEAHEKILQLEWAGQTATLDLVCARDAATIAIQDAKSRIDAIRLNNENNRLAWCDKLKCSPVRKTSVAVPASDHLGSHLRTIHLTTTEDGTNEDLTGRVSDDSATSSLWPKSRVRYSKAFQAELEQAELEFEQAQRADD